jgi:ABC-type branched-subunit amino acid transport system substrate-binding protein
VNVDKPIDLFYSYAHADAELRDQLDKHLSLLRKHDFIKQWYDRDICAGEDRSRRVDRHLNEARIILLLISSDYLESQYLYNIEMRRALERQEAGEVCVIPILLRPVDLQGAPFAHLEAFPQNRKPVTNWPDRDQAFEDIAKGLRRVVEELRIADQKVHSQNGEPVTTRSNPDQAFEDIAKGFRRILRELQERDIGRKTLRWIYTSIKMIINIIIAIHRSVAEVLRRGVESKIGVGRKIPLRVYSSTASMMMLVCMIILMLCFGSVGRFVPILSRPLFPALCSDNFGAANMSATDMSGSLLPPRPSNGDLIGLSEGATIFDRNRSDFQDKRQAAQDWVDGNDQDVRSSLQNAIDKDQTDAEAQIYLENRRVLVGSHPHITFVVGVSFSSSPPEGSPVDYNGSSRSILQGAFIAQKECNDQNKGDPSKALIVLMIANTGLSIDGKNRVGAHSVANWIVERTQKDPTIVGIMGWIYSPDSIAVNYQLKERNSDLPMVSPSSSADELEGMSHFFRVGHKNSDLVQMAAQFMLNDKQKKRIAILSDQVNTSYGNNLEKDFVTFIPKSDLISTEAYTEGDAKQIKDALTKVLAQKPDAVFFAGYEGDLFTFLEDLSHTSSKNLFVVSAPALSSTNDLLKPLPDLQNVYFPTSSSPNAWDNLKLSFCTPNVWDHPKPPFFQEYNVSFGKWKASTGLPSIDDDVMGSYDAMLTLLYASQKVLSEQHALTPSNLTEELTKITVTSPLQGVIGHIAFDSNGDQDQNNIMFMEHIEGTNLVIDKQQGCFLVTDLCCN